MDQKQIVQAFGGRLRVRVCGICFEEDALLMVRHKSLGEGKVFWAPPGGGLEYGESVAEAIEREFWEETGLKVAVGRFLFVHEFLKVPLHGIELFFEVKKLGGVLKTGADPEMAKEKQIIEKVAFVPFSQIQDMPTPNRHRLFDFCTTKEELLSMYGFFGAEIGD